MFSYLEVPFDNKGEFLTDRLHIILRTNYVSSVLVSISVLKSIKSLICLRKANVEIRYILISDLELFLILRGFYMREPTMHAKPK